MTAAPAAILPDLQRLTLAAARAGAQAIRRVLDEHRAAVEFKDGLSSSPVTAADRESERAIRDLVARHRGDDAFLGEEGGLQPGSSGLCWIVDPLDGTVNFSHGLPRYAVSVAVVEESIVDTISNPGVDGMAGRAVAATILQPATAAVLGLPHRTTRRPDVAVERSLVAFAVPNDPLRRRRAYHLLSDIAPRVQDLRNFGSTVCDLAAVATGELDAFITFDPAPWDVAAGVALVEAAGGRTRRWRGPHDLHVLATGSPTAVDALAGWLSPTRCA